MSASDRSRARSRTSLLGASAASRKKAKKSASGTQPKQEKAQQPAGPTSTEPTPEVQVQAKEQALEASGTAREANGKSNSKQRNSSSKPVAQPATAEQNVENTDALQEPKASQGAATNPAPDSMTSAEQKGSDSQAESQQPSPADLPAPPIAKDDYQGTATGQQAAAQAGAPLGNGTSQVEVAAPPKEEPVKDDVPAAGSTKAAAAGQQAQQQGEQDGEKLASPKAEAAGPQGRTKPEGGRAGSLTGDQAPQLDRGVKVTDKQEAAEGSAVAALPATAAVQGEGGTQEGGTSKEGDAPGPAALAAGAAQQGRGGSGGAQGGEGSTAEQQVLAMEQLGRIPVLSAAQRPGSKAGELVFEDDSGERIPVMTADYGFRSGGSRLYQQGSEGVVPASGFKLAFSNFDKELKALRRAVRFGEPDGGTSLPDEQNKVQKATSAFSRYVGDSFYKLDCWLEEKGLLSKIKPAIPRTVNEGGLSQEELEVLLRLGSLQLDDDQVAWREKQRAIKGQKPKAPFVINLTYNSLCWLLDVIFVGRPIQRFWFLETVARMPYFAYISMLHLYESLGWWRAGAELRKVHFAEEWNELHHLQIMEALGGDQRWVDRFLAEHAAVFYYWVLVLFYLVSPKWSYGLMELVEGHAADTYSQFAEQNEEVLKTIPPPLVALNYYKSGDLYLFDQLQTGWEGKEPRRPPCNNLYDVFINIRDDELEHTKTMTACKDGSIALDFQDKGQLGAYRQGGAQHIKVLDVSEAGMPGAKQWLTSTDLSSGSSDEGSGKAGRQ